MGRKYYKYDAYVERGAVSGKALSAIHQEICQMGFSGSRTPFYDHYKYLCDGHRGNRSKNWKPDPKKVKPQDDRSKLLPVKSIALVIDKAMKGRDLDGLSQKTFDTLISQGLVQGGVRGHGKVLQNHQGQRSIFRLILVH